MYAHCIFCNEPLGTNELLKTLPIGQRIAFDEARGRLWVICIVCQRWNLTPLEDRWESIAECSTAFRNSALKTGTENIQLCKLLDNTELVRIGDATATEFAAWRYGGLLGARRRRIIAAMTITVASTSVIGGVLVFSGLVPAFALLSLVSSGLIMKHAVKKNRMLRIPTMAGVLSIRAKDARLARLSAERDKELNLLLPAPSVLRGREPLPSERRWIRLSGLEAARALGRLMPAINSTGASNALVRRALGVLQKSGGVDETYFAVAKMRVPVGKLPKNYRLALEMCAHEVTERHALEGVLDELCRAWREADEIAAIADSLL